MNTQQSRNSRALEARDRLPYYQKLIKYGRLGGHSRLSRMKSCKKISGEDIQTDGQGNILNMPLLIGKPCFGIPTGYLRERCAPPILANGRYFPSSKCHGCKVRAGCHKVVVKGRSTWTLLQVCSFLLFENGMMRGASLCMVST